jgi:hypothetical protein
MLSSDALCLRAFIASNFLVHEARVLLCLHSTDQALRPENDKNDKNDKKALQTALLTLSLIGIMRHCEKGKGKGLCMLQNGR